MDFAHPLRVVTPTLEGDVLRVLAAASEEFTGSEIHRLVGHSSAPGVRKALRRLVDQGVVLSRKAGRATLYGFNSDHLAAEPIMQLTTMRETLIEQLRAAIEGWRVRPVVAALFGSAARGDAGGRSDIFLVRPAGADDDEWTEQVRALTDAATRWTGNPASPFELDEDDLPGAADEPALRDILEHGIELAGSLPALRRRIRQ